uniref:DUF5677 domain-containing protein n=1 Tax=Gelidibacter sp. TaxID=2018083 RepID=UPI00404B5AF8
MTEDYLYNDPLMFYNMLLLNTLPQIYTVRKNTPVPDWMQYSNLLLDKFAIHSGSFYHLSQGIIEHKKSGEKIKMRGYDLFTVNTTFRAIMETYATFNHIFVEPKSDAEKEFRFLLWKLDGFYQMKKFKINVSDFDGAKEVLEDNSKSIISIIKEIERSSFLSTLKKEQVHKIFNPSKNSCKWRFLIIKGNIKILQIIDLIEHTCNTRAFINAYKHSSIHIHSNFPAIEDFKRKRGKTISEEYTDPLTRLAIYLTCLLIYDICKIDTNANRVLQSYPQKFKEFIEGISNAILNFEE